MRQGFGLRGTKVLYVDAYTKVVHGLLDRVMLMLRVTWNGQKVNNALHTYYLKPADGNFTFHAFLMFRPCFRSWNVC